MKKLLLATTLTCMLFACDKEVGNNVAPISIAESFVGNWTVTEKVTRNVGSFTANATFTAPTTKINDSVFAIVQTHRTPDPAWVGSGSLSTDTFPLKPLVASGILNNRNQGNIGTYSENKDTFQIRYIYGPDAAYVYIVNQQWVRQ